MVFKGLKNVGGELIAVIEFKLTMDGTLSVGEDKIMHRYSGSGKIERSLRTFRNIFVDYELPSKALGSSKARNIFMWSLDQKIKTIYKETHEE